MMIDPPTRSKGDLDVGNIILKIPAWTGKLYFLMAAVLLPWTIYMSFALPRHHSTAHWDIIWSGLDIALVATVALTAYFAHRRSIWIVLTASTTGSLLVVDAWFDVLSEHAITLVQNALVMAIFLEIPLALMSYLLAAHVLRHNIQK